jgi:putative transposase
MPDHFHIIIDPLENEISNTMQRIKMGFATRYRKRKGLKSGRVWQNRFWDHILRNESDMNRHIDYIHYNPVHHGYNKSPFTWKHSSIHEYLKSGQYMPDWGIIENISLNEDFGE